MNSLHHKRGFTMVEILIVLGIVAILISLSAPFVSSLQRDITFQKNAQQAEFQILSTLNYALAGKSFTSLSQEGVKKEGVIPVAYGLYMKKGKYGSQPDYQYLEFKENGAFLEVIYKGVHPFSSESIYLDEISLFNTKKSVKSTNDLLVLIYPPFGKVRFIEVGKVPGKISQNLIDSPVSAYQEVQLSFQYKNEDVFKQVLSFNLSKELSFISSQ